MDILVVLRKLSDLEGEASKTYEWVASQFPEDAKAKEFFLKLSEDEKGHLDLVKYQERVVRKAPKDFDGVDVNMAAIDKTLAKIAEFRRTTPTVKDAIRFALDLETEITESYSATVMDQSNKNFAQLMKSLTANLKDEHYKQLIKFAQAYEG